MQVNETYMKMLYEAERAIQATNELAEIKSKVTNEYEKCKEDLEKAKSSKKGGVPLLLILLGVTVLFFFGSAGSVNKLFILRLLCRIPLAIMLFLDLAVISDFITSPKKIKKAEAALADAKRAMADYEKKFKNSQEDLSIGIQLWRTLMPQECMVPRYARKYISFFENRQATTEAEARNLFDLFLHREKMEGLAAKQIEAIQISNAEIISAANRATDAANAAASATRALDQTANYIRSK